MATHSLIDSVTHMIRGKKNKRRILLACWLALALAFSGGCAYYNTFYNIKKDFRAAEKQTQRSQAGQHAAPQQVGGQPAPGGVPVQQYTSILQSCAKLLEFYPNSRWIDDALMIMGVCYYRTDEFARSERKFTELTTIFPQSKHVQMATVWRARALVAQDSYEAAESFLTTNQSKLTSPNAIAASARTLASIYDKREQPEQAVTYLESIQNISYDREDKASDFLTLGRSYRALGNNEKAGSSLERCLNMTRNPDEAYESRRILAEMSALDGKYDMACNYLKPLTTDRRFIERSGGIQVEFAKVEALAGDPVRAIQLLEEFCSGAAQGELKARAFMIQGQVARDKLREFEVAKAKFDSVSSAGAPRSLQDSAEYASRQLQIGLDALASIPVLRDSLEILSMLPLDSRNGVEPVEDSVIQESAVTEAGMDIVDSSTQDTVSTVIEIENIEIDSTEIKPEDAAVDLAEEPVDTLGRDDSVARRSTMSPAQMMADSILRSLARTDSQEQAEHQFMAPADSLTAIQVDTSAAQASVQAGPTPDEIRAAKVASLSNRLVSSHLEASTFYNLVLHMPDSALTHLEHAAAVEDTSAEHWRASVQLGAALYKNDNSSARAKSLLETVAHEEQAPRGLRNAARDILGLEKLAVEKTPQDLALSDAESLLLHSGAVEDVLAAYQRTVKMDSLSLAGSKALQAIAYLQEYELSDFTSAMKTHEEIIRLFPDSSFISLSRARLLEPDSGSVFLMSDEALGATILPAMELLSAEGDSTGWPPEESSLRGRRFR